MARIGGVGAIATAGRKRPPVITGAHHGANTYSHADPNSNVDTHSYVASNCDSCASHTNIDGSAVFGPPYICSRTHSSWRHRRRRRRRIGTGLRRLKWSLRANRRRPRNNGDARRAAGNAGFPVKAALVHRRAPSGTASVVSLDHPTKQRCKVGHKGALLPVSNLVSVN